MTTVLFGSRNASKLARMQALFAPLGLELVGLDGSEAPEPDEGACVETNARTKALAYARHVRAPCIANDYGLRLDGLPDDEQPAAFVRRIAGRGRSATDAEMMDHYRRCIRELGGTTSGTWTGALAIAFDGDEAVSTVAQVTRTFVATPSETVLDGEPLASLQIDPTTGRYVSEVTFEQRAGSPSTMDRVFLDFVSSHLPRLRDATAPDRCASGPMGPPCSAST